MKMIMIIMRGNHIVSPLPFALTKLGRNLLFLITALFVWINPPAFGQQTQTNLLLQLDWVATLPFGAAFLATDGTGNIYSAASPHLSKSDANGVLLWTATNNDFSPIAMRVDTTGDVYLAGTIGGTNFAAAKYDSKGNRLWEQMYQHPGTSADSVAAAQIDGNGNIYLTGASVSGAGTNILTVKLSSNGTLLWATNYAGPLNTDSGAAVALDTQGNVYVTGSSAGFGTGNDVLTLKYDANGNQLWAVQYNGPENGDDQGSGIAVDTQGNIFVAGTSGTPQPPPFGGGGVLFTVGLKYDTGGNQLWAQRYRTPYYLLASPPLLAPDNLGGAYISAKFVYRNSSEAYVLKYNSTGTNVWSMDFWSSLANNYEDPAALELDRDGNALLALPTAFFKISPEGVVVWSLALPGQIFQTTTLAVDATNNFWTIVDGTLAKFTQAPVAGPAAAILFPSDGTSLKYPASVFIEATATESTSDLQIWDGNTKITDLASYHQLYSAYDFYSDAPTFTWNPPGGNHTLTARFTSQSGIQVTSAPVHLAIITNQFPIVTITNPANGAYFVAPAAVQIAAEANDPDGSVARVDFYAPNLLGEVVSSPYLLNFSSIPAGSYTLTAQATDNEGAVGVSPPVNFTVLPWNSPPLIVTETQSKTVSVGTNVTFSVQATGAPPLAYQWQFNGTNISGQTSAQLALTNVQPQASGIYDVVVTNQYGRVPSSNATLTLVSPALVFRTIATTSDGKLQLGVSAPSGSSIRIQTSSDLLNWTTLAQVTVTNQNFNLTYPINPQTTDLYFRLAAP